MTSLCTCAASGKLWDLLRNNLHLLDLQLLLDTLNTVEQKLLQKTKLIRLSSVSKNSQVPMWSDGGKGKTWKISEHNKGGEIKRFKLYRKLSMMKKKHGVWENVSKGRWRDGGTKSWKKKHDLYMQVKVRHGKTSALFNRKKLKSGSKCWSFSGFQMKRKSVCDLFDGIPSETNWETKAWTHKHVQNPFSFLSWLPLSEQHSRSLYRIHRTMLHTVLHTSVQKN